MFKLIEGNPVVWWPVKIPVPTDGGKTVEQKCELKFELLPDEEFDEIKNDDFKAAAGVIRDWKGISNSEGNALEFTPENLKLFMTRIYVRRAVFAAYGRATIGAAEKN